MGIDGQNHGFYQQQYFLFILMIIISLGLLLEHSCVCESSKVDHVILCMRFERFIMSQAVIVPLVGENVNALSLVHSQTCIMNLYRSVVYHIFRKVNSIAIIPFGSVNISYGSKVGSNHTSRYPNQVGYIGEGVFIGILFIQPSIKRSRCEYQVSIQFY